MVSIKDFGAVGDGVHDDTAAINAAVAAQWNGTVIVPYTPQFYKTTSPIALGLCILQGEGGRSTIRGDFDGFVLDRNTNSIEDAGPQVVERMCVANYHPTGGGVRLTGVINARASDLIIIAQRALCQEKNVFSFLAQNVRARASISGNPVGSYGFFTSGHAQLSSVDAVGYDHAIRSCGMGLEVRSPRLEVNRVALMLGMDVNGNDYALDRCSLTSLSMEANDTGIHFQHVANATVSGFGIAGTSGAPSGQSRYGIRVNALTQAKVSAGGTNGGFSTGGIVFDNRISEFTSFEDVHAANNVAGIPAWVLLPNNPVSFRDCNEPAH